MIPRYCSKLQMFSDRLCKTRGTDMMQKSFCWTHLREKEIKIIQHNWIGLSIWVEAPIKLSKWRKTKTPPTRILMWTQIGGVAEIIICQCHRGDLCALWNRMPLATIPVHEDFLSRASDQMPSAMDPAIRIQRMRCHAKRHMLMIVTPQILIPA